MFLLPLSIQIVLIIYLFYVMLVNSFFWCFLIIFNLYIVYRKNSKVIFYVLIPSYQITHDFIFLILLMFSLITSWRRALSVFLRLLLLLFIISIFSRVNVRVAKYYTYKIFYLHFNVSCLIFFPHRSISHHALGISTLQHATIFTFGYAGHLFGLQHSTLQNYDSPLPPWHEYVHCMASLVTLGLNC